MRLELDRHSGDTIQAQLRRSVIDAIHAGQLTPGQRLPPSRQLAGRLGIARNTVTAVYDELAARGYLHSIPRRGHFVMAGIAAEPDATPDASAAAVPVPPRSLAAVTSSGPAPGPASGRPSAIDWQARLKQRPSALRHIHKPSNWQDYPFPFVYGQVDPRLFPLNTWRACSRDALGRSAIDWWTADRAVEDDPQLIEQIRTQILPKRGIYAREDEILITLGSQEGFFLLARLLARADTRVGVETPGYPDSRNIFAAEGARMVDMAIDGSGARFDHPDPLDVAILTPAHHCPTMITMSPARRRAVIDRATRDGTILIEDDYEGETSFAADQTTLKSMDTGGRVVYLGTLSKVLAPGVRIGFMVADAALIAEARWLRRLIHRSAPLNNQRTAAIFLAEGHYLALLRQLRAALARRFDRVAAGCDRYLPDFLRAPGSGGSSVWLECPPGLDARALHVAARRLGVLAEDGDPFVPVAQAGRFLRLGISYIDEDRVSEGLRRLARAADQAG
ncbi:aminotransferase-like domain-containing protein [Frigidibacter sp. MR17.24]|uniref:aminotransferase-like domain-containing protein n=1 Tax=Frigidibacter sp. MR17.24 TaxID=3127345 RepID=UPI003012D867